MGEKMSGKSQEINKIAFINKANKVHNFKFDYSKFKYINAKTKSIITCPIHGDFEQNPDKHLNTKYGCKMCADENKNKNKVPVVQRESISKEEYINRFYTKYGTKFKIDLSKYEEFVI
jgi:hypothetical protein